MNQPSLRISEDKRQLPTMPLITRLYLKTGLVYLAIAMAMGVLMAAQPVFQLSPALLALRPVFLHLLIVGWLTQLIFGVAYWMFPKQSKENPRGSALLGWSVFGLLNGGLVIRAFCEPLVVIQPQPVWGYALVTAAILQVAGGWLFIASIWRRVKER